MKRDRMLKVINTIREKQKNRAYKKTGFRLIDLFNPYYIDRKTIYDFIAQTGKNIGGGVIS